MADDYQELSELGRSNLEKARNDLLPSVRAKFDPESSKVMTPDIPEPNREEKGLQARSFAEIQRMRRDPSLDEETRQNLNYEVQAMVKQAEDLGAMDFAKEYIRRVYKEEPDFRKTAERMVNEASQIEEQAKDPQMNPLSGYIHAKPLHGIVREAINTQAEALMVLHYAQMASHPQADQEEYQKLFSEAAAAYSRSRFWDADIKPGEGGRSISDLVNLPEITGQAGEALHDAFGITPIELSAARAGKSNDERASGESTANKREEDETVEGMWEEVEENPESEGGKEVEKRLSEFRERVYSARNQGQRVSIVRERDNYLNSLHREGRLPENVKDMEKLWAMELIEGVDSTRPSSSLREKLDEMIDRADREGTLTDELRQLLSFEVRGVIKVARLNAQERSGDRLKIERMANLPLAIPQDDIDAAWTRRAEAHAAGGENVEDLLRGVQELLRRQLEMSDKQAQEFREMFERQTATLESMLDAETRRTAEYARTFRETLSPEEERMRWAQVMLRNDLYTRFTPNMEPRFYSQLIGYDKDEYDALLQIGRAAYVKKVTSTHPDEYGSDRNQDMLQLLKENAEILYNKAGVRQMMEGYAQAIVGRKDPKSGRREFRKFTLGDGRTFDFWECPDVKAFDEIRSIMRAELMEREDLTELQAVEADVAGWNLLYVGLLPESGDSRYSFSGQAHSKPYAMLSQEFRTVLHEQEWWETKMSVGHQDYGRFGVWGVTQMNQIKQAVGFKPNTHIFVFEDAEGKEEFWQYRVGKAAVQAIEVGRQVDKIPVHVKMPVCQIPTVLGSLWEETKVWDAENPEKNEELPLLQFLVEGRPIPWEYVDSGFVGSYAAKLDKAYKALNNYYKPDAKSIPNPERDSWVDWASGFNEIREARMKIATRRNPRTNVQILSPNAYHNLKVFAYIAVRGIKDTTKKIPSPNVAMTDKASDIFALQSRKLGYLDRTEGLGLR